MAYLIYLPNGYDTGKDPVPLFTFLHGNTHQGNDHAGLLSAPGYAIWLMLANSVVQAAIGLAARGLAVTGYAVQHWRRVLVGGVFTLFSYPIVLWAMTRAPVALVAVLRETSVLFAAVLGALFLGERFTPRRLVATGAVLAGLTALRL